MLTRPPTWPSNKGCKGAFEGPSKRALGDYSEQVEKHRIHPSHRALPGPRPIVSTVVHSMIGTALSLITG